MRKLLIAAALIAGQSPASAETVIAAFGDSLTQGYGLVPEDGFVAQLQNWLDEAGADVRLINAGVSGDTTAGGLARIGWALTPEVDGMIVTLGGNDLLRGLDPAQAKTNLTGILDAAEDAEVEVLLVGLQAPGNFGPEYKTAFDAIYPDLAAEYGTGYFRNFFAGLVPEGEGGTSVSLQKYFLPDGLHPNAEGVSRIVEGIGPTVLELVERVEAD